MDAKKTDSRKTIRQNLDSEQISKTSSDITGKLLSICSGICPGHEDPVLSGLLDFNVAETIRRSRWNSLVINPGSTSTKVSIYTGLTVVASEEITGSGESSPQLDARVSQVFAWMKNLGLDPFELNGIAARGGLMAPVRAGTYRICNAMLEDLARSRIFHPSNLAAPMAHTIGRQIGPDVLLTTTDPVMVDEIDDVHRITGSAKILDDGTAAHYLNHRSVARLCAKVMNLPVHNLHIVTCHMGGGMSAARHLGGRVVQVAQAFGTIPSSNRSGRLPLHHVLRLMENRRYDLDDLRKDLTMQGGLIALAGTNDFRKLFKLAREEHDDRAKKASLLVSFYSNRIAGCILELSAHERPLDAIVLTGGLAYDEAFFSMVANRLHLGVPIARLPGSIEQAALAAGLLNAFVDSSALLDYAKVKQKIAQTYIHVRSTLDLELFPDDDSTSDDFNSPPKGLDDLVQSACGSPPVTIAVVGADNTEALLAVKQAVEQNGLQSESLAKFLLVGPWGAVTRLAWELDLPIDDQVVTLLDAPCPVEASVELLKVGAVDTLMKGSVHTAHILKGYLKYLKSISSTKNRLSHIALFDIPGRKKLLAVTDAAMNTYPDIPARISILENALRCLDLLGYKRPKVAVLSATEEASSAVESSIDAKKITEYFQHRDDLTIEGPMALDLAMSPDSAREKHYQGKIQGDADLLLVPDIDVGNAVYKAFTVAAEADTAGAIIGGPRPIILTSRGDNARSKLSAIALAVVLTSRAKHRGNA